MLNICYTLDFETLLIVRALVFWPVLRAADEILFQDTVQLYVCCI